MSEGNATAIRDILEKDSPAYIVGQFDGQLAFHLHFHAKTQFLKDVLHTRLRALVQKWDQEAVAGVTLDPVVR